MAKQEVLFFVEDNAQEQILPSLFARIAVGLGVDDADVRLRVVHSRGGDSIRALRDYLRDYPGSDDITVVLGSDGNCKGFAERRKTLVSRLERETKGAKVIFAIPNPHIERWYLIDHKALSAAVGKPVTDHAPDLKCDKGRYKVILRDAIRSTGVTPLQGGAEYGSEIADTLDLYRAGKDDHGFKFFHEQVKEWAKARI